MSDENEFIPEADDWQQMMQDDERQMAEEAKQAAKEARLNDILAYMGVGMVLGGVSPEDMADEIEQIRRDMP